MKKYQVRKYQSSDFHLWNTFISIAKNSTFLFHRDFIEYHSDRFEDYSVMVFDAETLVAVLPCNRVGNTIFSHQGLSYGGLLIKDIRLKEYINIFKQLLQFFNIKGIEFIEMKALPKIYNQSLSDEIDYVLFLLQATLYRSDAYLVIDCQEKYAPNRNRKRALKIASKLKIEIKEESNYVDFWTKILIPNLRDRFDVTPVHTIEEIMKLAHMFPDTIKLYNAYEGNKLKAGVVMFITNNVAHFQYSSGGNDRNDTASLDILFDEIIKNYSCKKYISFGSSSEDNGLKLNDGLVYWKESFGAKTTTQNFYKIKTSNFYLLDTI